MTKEEAINTWLPIIKMGVEKMPECKEALDIAIKALEREPCEDAISRQAVHEAIVRWAGSMSVLIALPTRETIPLLDSIHKLPSVKPQEIRTGHCKGCKYFEYDSVAKVDGIPLIVAHEICSRWGAGCKTKEDGYCFLFEPQESEDK
jgi:hypothetical protein